MILKRSVIDEDYKGKHEIEIVPVGCLQLLPVSYITGISSQNFSNAGGQEPANTAAADEVRQHIVLKYREGDAH